MIVRIRIWLHAGYDAYLMIMPQFWGMVAPVQNRLPSCLADWEGTVTIVL